jgi:hypothetical protein
MPLVSWEALKLVFEMIPGICLVTWAGYKGWAPKRARLADLFRLWSDVTHAKRAAFEETGRIFFPVCPILGAILFAVILFVIPTDRVLVVVLNACAIPAAVVCYWQGRCASRFRAGEGTLQEFDLPWRSMLFMMTVWIGAAGVVLGVLKAAGVWRP